MKIQSIATAILSLAASTSTSAFTSTSFRKASASASASVSESNTKLFISSWGAKGPPGRYKEEDPNPAQKIQSYLKAPEPIPARSNLDGTILVSGWVNNKDRTDQTIFNFLNEEESAFQFTKIIAFVNDAKFAKKRLISRSARYSGLLDKLDFTQAETEDALPTAAQLEGVTSWVANAGSSLDTVIAVSKLAAASPDLKNVAVLLTDGQTITDSSAAKDAVDQLGNDPSTTFTVVTVGAITETPEGQLAYSISDFGNGDEATLLPSNATYSRDESLRVVAECLGLESACNKAMVFTEVQSADVNNTAYKLVKGLREGGYTRPQELHHMIEKGPVAYTKAIEDYKTRVPSVTPQDEWLAQKQKELDENAADRKARIAKDYEDAKINEIESIAREWAKREYFRKATSGDMPYSEEEYIKSVWERALFEGDLKYRMLHGQETDERKELAEFKKKQEKKKAMMLERAKAALNQALGEDDALVPANKGDDDDDDE